MTTPTPSEAVEEMQRRLMVLRDQVEVLTEHNARQCETIEELQATKTTPSPAQIEAAAEAMMRSMFAPHELPLDDELRGKYMATATEALTAAADTMANPVARLDAGGANFAPQAMTAPTPAQIEAALPNAVRRFLDGRMKHFTDSRFVDDDLVELAAALTAAEVKSCVVTIEDVAAVSGSANASFDKAAAGVGPEYPDPAQDWVHRVELAEIKQLKERLAAVGVVEDAPCNDVEWEKAKRDLVNRTLKRCAQVVEQFEPKYDTMLSGKMANCEHIAAAIRALKDKP